VGGAEIADRGQFLGSGQPVFSPHVRAWDADVPSAHGSWHTEGVRRSLIAAAVAVTAGLVFAYPVAARQQPPPGMAPFLPCSLTNRNLLVRDILDDIYLWYQFLPDIDPTRFTSPEAYLEAVRYRPLDTSFSSVVPKATFDALFSNSQFVGFGFSTRTTETAITILQVFPDSSAAEAQLARGDRIVAVDGRTIASLVASGGINTVFGAPEAGVTVTADVITRSGAARQVTLRKRVVTIPPVSLTRTFLVDGRVVGYIFFRQFVRPSTAALDEAFAALRAAGATELVLDLRYNGGGLVDVAVHLASLIGDAALRDQVFARLQHNDKNTASDQTLRFETIPSPLRLSRLIAITSRGSASASELLINGLRPYLPVVVIGDRTFGKPVGQYSIEFCDRVLLPVSFITVNARGDGNYFGGIAADCPAADDASHDLGAAEEASLAQALLYIRSGACFIASPPPAIDVRQADGWQALINAQ
jgi:C-terminal peptidase prc